MSARMPVAAPAGPEPPTGATSSNKADGSSVRRRPCKMRHNLPSKRLILQGRFDSAVGRAHNGRPLERVAHNGRPLERVAQNGRSLDPAGIKRTPIVRDSVKRKGNLRKSPSRFTGLDTIRASVPGLPS